MENLKAIIEAILFSSDRPVLVEQIKSIDEDLSSKKIREVMLELKDEYAQADRGIRIVEVAGGFQMVSSPELHPVLRKFFKDKRKQRLSKAGLETLAIIAYKQPITKLQIKSLRQVEIDGLIHNLKELGLIRVVGRRKAPGRPYLYGTTRQFLEFFGLNSLDELPKVENLSINFSLVNNQTGKEKDGDNQTAQKD